MADVEALAADGGRDEAADGAQAPAQPDCSGCTPADAMRPAEADEEHVTDEAGEPGHAYKRHVHVYDLRGTCWRNVRGTCGFERGETCDMCRCGAIWCVNCDHVGDASQATHAAPTSGARAAHDEATPARTASQLAAEESEAEERSLISLNQACAADPEVRADVDRATRQAMAERTSLDVASHDDHALRLDIEYELMLRDSGYDLVGAMARAHLHGGVT